MYAVGGNQQAAEFQELKWKSKILCTCIFWIDGRSCWNCFGFTYVFRTATAGDGAEMDAIAAVVVGGTSMAGGSGKIGGTIIGGLIIGVLNNGLNLLNVNSFWQYVVKGVVILLAVFLDYFRNKGKK